MSSDHLKEPAETRFPGKGLAGEDTPGMRERKRRARNDHIIDCAVALFQENGYEQTRMEEIAAEADISAPTLYRYFPTKSALLIALLWKERQNRIGMLEAFHKNAGTMGAVEAVTGLLFLNNLCGRPKKARRLWREMSSELLRSHDIANDDFRMIKQEFEEHIARMLRGLHERGALLRDTPLRPTMGVLYAVAAENFHRLIANEFRNVEEERRALQEQVTLVLQGWVPK